MCVCRNIDKYECVLYIHVKARKKKLSMKSHSRPCFLIEAFRRDRGGEAGLPLVRRRLRWDSLALRPYGFASRRARPKKPPGWRLRTAGCTAVAAPTDVAFHAHRGCSPVDRPARSRSPQKRKRSLLFNARCTHACFWHLFLFKITLGLCVHAGPEESLVKQRLQKLHRTSRLFPF